MKRNATVRIVLYSIALALLVTVLGVGLAVNLFSFHPFQSNHEVIGEQIGVGSVEADAVKKLRIEWVSGSITVKTGTEQTVSFSESADVPEDQQMTWKLDGDRLVLQFSKTKVHVSLFGAKTMDKDLVVTVPQGWECNALEIDSVSADIRVSDVTAQKMELVNVSGDCIFDRCKVGQLRMETVSGDVEYEGLADNVNMETVSGNCTATLGGTPNRIELDCVSGDLKLHLPEITGFTAKMDSLSGKPAIEFPVTTSEKTYTYGDGSCRITVGSVSGGLSIGK